MASRALGKIVACAINLDAKPRFRAVEIERVFGRRLLTSEMEADPVLSKLLPQQHFGQAHFAAQAAGVSFSARGALPR